MQDKPTTILELFERAEDSWTQGHFALRPDGKVCDVDEPEACCFCLDGAAIRVYACTKATMPEEARELMATAAYDGRGEHRLERYWEVRDLMNDMLRDQYGFNGGIINWNDQKGRTRQEILDFVRKCGV